MWSKDQLLIFLLLLFLVYNLLHFSPTLLAPLSSCSPDERGEEFFFTWVREQQQRRANVAKTCASDTSWMEDDWEKSPNNKQAHFIYNPDHNILGCLQPKVRDEFICFGMAIRP